MTVVVGRCSAGQTRPETPSDEWRLACPAQLPAPMRSIMWWSCCLRTGPWTTCWAASTGRGTAKPSRAVIGKELSNPIPGWAEHGAGRKVVPYGVTTEMDSPNPDSGEEWYHTNTHRC
jgi:hypothetical protein